ncbi:hypothetical protein HGRIS_002017 [Hohenbuehelia grisea]|uniref:Uncharacterized protein n=1 Tax=Hohenbuehelia grisea TaxID=104357 RepID=A0ABR3JL04_9AGAR
MIGPVGRDSLPMHIISLAIAHSLDFNLVSPCAWRRRTFNNGDVLRITVFPQKSTPPSVRPNECFACKFLQHHIDGIQMCTGGPCESASEIVFCCGFENS